MTKNSIEENKLNAGDTGDKWGYFDAHRGVGGRCSVPPDSLQWREISRALSSRQQREIAMKESCRTEPFFISEETEAELLAARYVFEPPSHARTASLPEVLMSLTDGALAAWAQGDVE
ncbi:hypothetical protein LMG33810_001962 [Carnimonas sp. LMG 33810]